MRILARLKMSKPMLLLRTALVLVGIAVLVALAGCKNPLRFSTGSLPSNHGRPPVNTTQVNPSTGNEPTTGRPIQVVTSYLTALQEGRYNEAYAMLSSESRKIHSAADFEQLGKKGMPLYDLNTAKAIEDGEKPVIEVRLNEEPGSHGFNLVRESDTWKIVYRGGIPGSPDP